MATSSEQVGINLRNSTEDRKNGNAWLTAVYADNTGENAAAWIEVTVEGVMDADLERALYFDVELLNAEFYGEALLAHPLQLEFPHEEYRLLGAIPNPFDELTDIRFELPRAERVTLTVMDVRGREVFRTVRELEAGAHGLPVRAGDLHAAGLYYYRVSAGEWTESGSVVLK